MAKRGKTDADAAPTEGRASEGEAKAGPERRVELVEPAPPNETRARYIGLGLLLSVVLGFEPLREAALGAGSFPTAMARYLACLVCSVVGVLGLGRLIDGAPPPPEDETPDDEVEPEA